MTIQFDKKHCSSNLQDKVYVKLIKKNHMKYHVSLSSSLTIKKLESYFIKQKINFLIYEIDLSFDMKIHFVISIIHLKQFLILDEEEKVEKIQIDKCDHHV